MRQSKELKLPSLRGQRILITGGLGFIGSNLAHLCVKLGAEVTIYDCLDPRSGGRLYNIDDIQRDLETGGQADTGPDILGDDRLAKGDAHGFHNLPGDPVACRPVPIHRRDRRACQRTFAHGPGLAFAVKKQAARRFPVTPPQG